MSRRALAVLLVVFIHTLAAFAGLNRWTTSGPEGAQISQIVADPDQGAVAYAATKAGLFKTSNSGERWQAVNEGLPKPSVANVLVVPDAPSTLYATIGQRIFVSTDGAEHWSERGSVPADFVLALALNTATRTLYAGTTGGFYTSEDDGRTWRLVDEGRFFSLAVSSSGTAYAIGQRPGGGQASLFRSTDNGQTWTFVNRAPFGYGIVADRESPKIYIVDQITIHESSDEGQSWRQLPPIPSFPMVNLLIPARGHLYASTHRGVFDYSEGSRSWTSVGSSLSSTNIRAFAVSPSVPRQFWAAGEFGLNRMIEGETDWVSATNGLPGAQANDVALVDRSPGVAYAATNAGSFKTTNHGESWQQIQPNLHALEVEVVPDKPDTVYLSTAGLGSQRAVLKTTDGGANWKQLSATSASKLAVAPSDSATLYAALTNAMSKSTNGGESFVSIMSGMYYFFYYGFTATSLAVDPSDSSNVFVSTVEGTFKTVDAAARWKKTSNMSNVSALAIDDATSTIYAAPHDGGVVSSLDAGTTWLKAGLTDKRVLSLALHQSVLYAGTEDGHVYRSNDRGQTWSVMDRGLSRASVLRLAIDSSGNYFYAATSGGVYEYRSVPDDILIETLPSDPNRAPGLLDQWLRDNADAGLLLPVVGSTTGVSGTRFSTEITLRNLRDSRQDVIALFLPRGDESAHVSFRLSLPASSESNGGAFTVSDFSERFGISGTGSLLVIAVDATGRFDPAASIEGSAEVWTHPADQRAPFSQSIPAVRPALIAGHSLAEASGFHHDATFRTNIGIANLSSEWHQFTIQINGQMASGQFTLAVAPFSLVQTPLPDTGYGALSLVVLADTSTTPWMFYGSSINNSTGEARMYIGTPAGN